MSGQKILIVDDEADTLKVLEKRLSLSGYVVISVNNGEDALRLAREEHPDLVVLDIMMPWMDGIEVNRRLKEEPLTKDIPVIFLTCLFTQNDEQRQGHEIGKCSFVAKPYNPDELLEEIKKRLAA